jgi:hypothetical protein
MSQMKKQSKKYVWIFFRMHIDSIVLFYQLIRAAKDTDSFLRREVLQTVQTNENTYRMYYL